MIENHRYLSALRDEMAIWRYMSSNKFLDLLHNGSLYLTRIDCFEDPYEGRLSAYDKDLFGCTSETNPYWERERKRNFISCWTETGPKSQYMWENYGSNGVVIESDVLSLKNSLLSDSSKCYLSRVKYIDYNSGSSQDAGTPLNILKIIFTKDNSFKQEREVRLLYFDASELLSDTDNYKLLDVDVKHLIKRVITSSTMDSETKEYLKNECTKYNVVIS
jgi:hypothetical protein